MTSIKLFRHNGRYTGFESGGHCGYAEEGADIVCAAVSSAVSMVLIAITEVEALEAEVTVDEEQANIALMLNADSAAAQTVLEAFCRQMAAISAEFPQCIDVKILEV